VECAHKQFTSSRVTPINSFGKDVIPPGSSDSKPRGLPLSTIYGFNGAGPGTTAKFAGARINAEYGRPAVVRFENTLGEANGFDRMDFGAPNYSLLIHLHNGHTAPESDGNPHYAHFRFKPMNRFTHEAAWEPGEWVDQMYLGYPAGGDDNEKQSFFWFHDHVHGHTGANVHKGMVGLMPLYDPKIDNGDETDPNGLKLPGRRTQLGDGHFKVDYDIPLALYDCRLDDGVTPHKDAHTGTGETHPKWWGKTYFRHFPNHGFVGDIFTVNGTAYPVMKVKRRKYRLRFLDCSISRIYELQLMQGTPKSARSLGYTGDELQGQWRLPDGRQCMQFVEVANEGGLLPKPILRDSFDLWPAKRREVVVDFTKYQDGSYTKAGDELYLVDIMKMTTGRMWDAKDPNYKVPLMKIVIEGEAPEKDMSIIPASLRPAPDLPIKDWKTPLKNGVPTFELQRGSSNTDPETEWLINGQTFDPESSMISPEQGSAAVWKVRNGGGGWVHPFHLHMEEHRVLQRNGKDSPEAGHPDDTGKEDVVALDPSEEVIIQRQFRTFTGPYVAHCHNLAHEDHNMMFGWDIKPKSV